MIRESKNVPQAASNRSVLKRGLAIWKTAWPVTCAGIAAAGLYTQWAAAQQVPPGGGSEPIPVGISAYYCYDPGSGTTSACSGNPDNGYDNSGNYFVEDPQNYDYNSDPASYPNQVFGDEYLPQRQQYLLQSAIYQGQNNLAAAADNFNSTIPALLEDGQRRIEEECDNGAVPAYDTAFESFGDVVDNYNEALDSYNEAAQQYQTAKSSFTSASNTPYIYDQLAGMNRAYSDLSDAASKLAEAEKRVATAQQQYAIAQQDYMSAAQAELKCKAVLSIVNTNFAYNNAQTNSYLLYAAGQRQQADAAQKQWEVSRASQELRVTYGLQQANAQALQGLVPSTGGALESSPRPTEY